jgi:hypothetical protein
MTACPPLAPVTEICAGRGICGNRSTGCECFDGWYSGGDFIFNANVQCDISGQAVQVLWAVAGAVSLMATGSCAVLFARLLDLPRRNVPNVLFLAVLLIVACSFIFAVLAIVKATATNPADRAIGIDVWATSLYCTGLFLAWIATAAAMSYTLRVLASLAGWPLAERRKFVLKYSWLTLTSNVSALLSVLGPLIPLFAGSENGFAYACLHYLAFVGIMLTMGAWSILLVTKIEGHLALVVQSSATNNETAEKFKYLMVRIRRVKRTALFEIPWLVALSFVNGVWAGVQRFASYELPLLWTVTIGLNVAGFCYVTWPRGNRRLSKLNGGGAVTGGGQQATSLVADNPKFRRLVTIVELDDFVESLGGGGESQHGENDIPVTVSSATGGIAPPRHRVVVRDDDVLLCVIERRFRGFSPQQAAAAQAFRLAWLEWLLENDLVWVVLSLISCSALAFMGAVLAEVVNQWLSLLLLMPLIIGAFLLSFTFSLGVLEKLMHTVFFRARVIVVLVSLVLVSLAMQGDARILVLLVFAEVQITAFAGDAWVEQARPLRRVAVVWAILMSLELWLLMQTNLVADYANIKISCGEPGNNISLYQMARDGIFGEIFLLVFELEFVVRGSKTSRQRFLHIGDVVWRKVVTFDEEHDNMVLVGSPHLGVNAAVSQMELRSGFFAVHQTQSAAVANENLEGAAASITKVVYVDCVLLKQSSCMACHLFGKERGEAIFRALDGPLGSITSIFVNFSAIGVFVCLILGYDPRICYIALLVSGVGPNQMN